MMPSQTRWTVLAVLMALLLGACAGTGPGTATTATGSTGADSAFSRGDYGQAAELWQQQAVDASPRRASALRVRSADAWLLDGREDHARDLLPWISRDDLGSEDRARLDLVLADLALRSLRPDEAEQLLRKAKPVLPWSSMSRYDDLDARLQQQLSSPGSRDLAEAQRRAGDMGFYDPEEALALIRSLETVSSGELAVRADNPRGDRQMTGWLDLALVIRQNLVEPGNIVEATGEWKERNPQHPLNAQQALDTWLRYRQMFHPPRRVAVLLPASGRLQAAGKAIRDGIMSAYLDQPGGSEILFFATNDEEQSAISAYFSALDAGADLIIGPLRKESIAAMLNLAGMSTPVLALNDVPAGLALPPGIAEQVSGISLSQDREVVQLAEHAAASGYLRAMVIAPESAWGERMVSAFQGAFLHDEAEIVAAARFEASDNDYSSTLERLLKIDESKARKMRLENTLQTTLEFEPSRRDDIDVIFMAANASQARLIRPQLRFHDAGDIPLYAPGRVYSGRPDPVRNQDLNGVRFPAAPWYFDHSETEDIPELDSIREGALGSLFALGQDAWNMLPWLELMRKDPEFVFDGQSGGYRAGGQSNFERLPAWAEFRRGRPAVLRPAGD